MNDDQQGQAARPSSDDVLATYRASIDNLDAALIHLLSERFKLTKKVGEYKREHQLPPADKSRESDQIKRLRQLAWEADLDPEFAERLLRFIIDEVIRHHERLRADAPSE